MDHSLPSAKVATCHTQCHHDVNYSDAHDVQVENQSESSANIQSVQVCSSHNHSSES